MRDKIAEIVFGPMLWSRDIRTGRKPLAWVDGGNSIAQDEARRAANAIIAALPDMVVPLVWTMDDRGHQYSSRYVLVNFSSGYLVDFADLSLGNGFTLDEAKAVADTHHTSSIMAAFGVVPE